MKSALSGHIHIVYDVPRDTVHRASPWHPSSPYSGSQAGQDCTRVFIFTLRGQLQGGREECSLCLWVRGTCRQHLGPSVPLQWQW